MHWAGHSGLVYSGCVEKRFARTGLSEIQTDVSSSSLNMVDPDVNKSKKPLTYQSSKLPQLLTVATSEISLYPPNTSEGTTPLVL